MATMAMAMALAMVMAMALVMAMAQAMARYYLKKTALFRRFHYCWYCLIVK